MTTPESCVLYVDDERPNRVVFEQSFSKHFRIKAVSSAEEALQVMKTEEVAVLVTDQRMPGMNGNELLVRAKALHPSTVRIVITAYSDIDPILRAVNEGLVARYIVKPWDRAELRNLLQWAVEAYELGKRDSALQVRLLETERLATLGSISAAVMHDLTQPLAYLTTNSQRLTQLARASEILPRADWTRAKLSTAEEELIEHLRTELPDLASDMAEGTNVLHQLTRTMQKFARPIQDADRICEPLPIVRYAISVCRDIALRARGTIIYDGPASLAKARINSTELIQVLINVIANASHALVSKGTPGGRVVVSPSDGHDHLRFVVTDEGSGMDEATLKKVGTPFFSTRTGGTGLGVLQSRKLVEGAGGTFKIDSTVGLGTTVTITIPRV